MKAGLIGLTVTRLGAGPNGETLVFDSEEAINLYNFRLAHQLQNSWRYAVNRISVRPHDQQVASTSRAARRRSCRLSRRYLGLVCHGLSAISLP